MQDITWHFNLQTLPPVFSRKDHVTLVLLNSQNQWLLGGKTMYPAGIVRLLGGGVEAGETSNQAAIRELKEETGLENVFLKPAAQVTCHITVNSQETIFTAYLFTGLVSSGQYQPQDDVQELVWLDEVQMHSLVEAYKKLPTEVDSEVGFAWADYGQVFAPLHQLAIELGCDLVQ